MSITLDALRKSENERQGANPAEFAAIPSSSASPSVPRWLWIVASLLAINLVVLFALLLKPDSNPATPAPAEAAVASTAHNEVPQASFADQVAVARQNVPVEPAAPVANEGPVEYSAPTQTASALPGIQEVRVRGAISIADLHLDIHVYSTAPEDRFVFINMSKHREGSYLDEGPAVIEITPDGVVLEYQGTSFLLPRE